MNRDSVTIVDGSSVPRVNGMDAFQKMDADFRDNLGDPSRVEELLGKYNLRTLWRDERTTRRIDHVIADAGYRDLSEAYHGSVEEGYVIGGEIILSAEGSHIAGDYFWRPPGWVHSAYSDSGFDMLLMMEGSTTAESSGAVSRVVCPDSTVGTNLLEANRDPVGPRGYVRRAEARYQPWVPGGLGHAGIGPASAYAHKLLSGNTVSGSLTAVLRAVDAGVIEVGAAEFERFFILTAGSLTVRQSEETHRLEPVSLVHVPPTGSANVSLSLSPDAEVLLKTAVPV